MLFTSIARKPYQCSMGRKTLLLRVTSKTSSSSSAAADIVGILLDGKGPAAVQVVTKVAVATEKTARSKRASPRPHHDRERL
jgi:hypothetical protein